MRRTRNIVKETEEFFEKLGLNDELEKLSGLFTDNFMISGEETEDLKEALHRAPDSLLDLIWEKITDAEEESEADRQQKEKILYEEIPKYLESRLILMDSLKLQLLIRVMNNHPIELVETTSFYEDFVPYGWVFTFYKDGNCSFAVMKEVRSVIMSIEKPEIEKQMEAVFGVRCMVNVCLGLYGVFKLEQIRNVYKAAVGTDGMEETDTFVNFDKSMEKILPYFEEQGLFWSDRGYLVSPYLQDREEYRELLRNRQNEYYIPDEHIIQSYSLGKILEKNEEYEAVFKLLSKEIKDCSQAEEMLEEISGSVASEDWDLPQVINCLYEWDVIFDNYKSAEKMTSALSEWLYGIRRWSECGYSRREKNKENINLQYIAYANKGETEKKIAKKLYPNDPCPCGSGKKYKKCCGRK